MLPFDTWMIFFASALALAFAPGPGMLYVLSRTIEGGRPAGLASTLGAALGGTVHVFSAALGISAILATSALAFSVVKYLGAAFLIYLGIKMIASALTADTALPEINVEQDRRHRSAFYQGIVSEVLNPKTAVFFLAFIPQFIRPADGGVFGQFILLGVIVVLLNMIPDLIIAFFAGPIARWWRSSRKIRCTQQLVSGSCLIGLGVYLAVSGTNKNVTLRQ